MINVEACAAHCRMADPKVVVFENVELRMYVRASTGSCTHSVRSSATNPRHIGLRASALKRLQLTFWENVTELSCVVVTCTTGTV